MAIEQMSPDMFSWTPAAVQAWAALAMALAAVIGIPFLLWDRFWPPHQIAVEATSIPTSFGWLRVRIRVGSIVGERVSVDTLRCPRGLRIAPAPTTTPEILYFDPDKLEWRSRLHIPWNRPQGHAVSDDELFVFLRDRRPAWLLWLLPGSAAQPRLLIGGTRPYHSRRRFRIKSRVHPRAEP